MNGLDRLVDEVCAQKINRRQFVQRAFALGFSATATGTLLAACGRGDETASTGASRGSLDDTKPERLILFN